MTIEQVKQNLNKTVLFSNPKLYLENEKYILVGCIIRRGEQGFFYQAELQDINQPKSISFVAWRRLKQIAAWRSEK